MEERSGPPKPVERGPDPEHGRQRPRRTAPGRRGRQPGLRQLLHHRAGSPTIFVAGRALPLLRSVLPYLVFLWACRRYQRFHFYCNARPARTRRRRASSVREELQMLRTLGKQIFFWTYGADVRTREATRRLGEPNCCTHCPAPARACVCDDRRGQANLARIAAAATAVFAMGDMIEYTPGSRNDLFFWPVDLDADGGRKYAPHYPPAEGDGPLRIVHAPNHRHFKGTSYLLDAVERLRRQGHAHRAGPGRGRAQRPGLGNLSHRRPGLRPVPDRLPRLFRPGGHGHGKAGRVLHPQAAGIPARRRGMSRSSTLRRIGSKRRSASCSATAAGSTSWDARDGVTWKSISPWRRLPGGCSGRTTIWAAARGRAGRTPRRTPRPREALLGPGKGASMKAAIIGAAGFLGRALCKQLQEGAGKSWPTTAVAGAAAGRGALRGAGHSPRPACRFPAASRPSSTWPSRRAIATFPRRPIICSA